MSSLHSEPFTNLHPRSPNTAYKFVALHLRKLMGNKKIKQKTKQTNNQKIIATDGRRRDEIIATTQ